MARRDDSVDDSAFIDAILAAPEDDTPRLVYADALLERGDPRGDLITLQCARARLEREGRRRTAEHAKVCADERAVYAAHVKSWVKPFGLTRWFAGFERGFVSTISLPIKGLQLRWPMFARLPIHTITLSMRPRMGTLADIAWAAEHARAVRTIEVDGADGVCGLDPEVLRAQLRELRSDEAAWSMGLPHPLLRSAIRTLQLWMPSPDVTSGLAELHGTTKITVNDGSRFAASDLARLAASQLFRSAEELWVGFLQHDGARALFRGLDAPAVHTLTVTANQRGPFAPSVGPAFEACTSLGRVTSLRTDLVLDPAIAAALEAHAPALESVAFDREAAPGGVEALLANPRTRALKELFVAAHAHASARLLADVPFTDLRALNLYGFTIDEATATALANASSLAAVTEFAAHPTMWIGPAPRAILHARWPLATLG